MWRHLTRAAPIGLLAAAMVAAGSSAAAAAARQAAPARDALRRAEALFHPQAPARERAAAPHDGTLALRDLALHMGALSPAGRRAAHGLLARPSDPYDPNTNPDAWTTPEAATSPECGPDVCVHWTDTGTNAPDLTDADANGYPDTVDATLAVAEDVWNTEVAEMGYRAPLDDSTSPDDGGSGLLDVYLSDVGAQGLYGYCASDDPKVATLGQPGVTWDVSAYCVVDNDYAEPIFGAHTPLQNLQVTMAHEFFHAVQFAYDFGEDRWLMEGTATWMEDQVYDAINDNRQYLATSQLRYPWVPLDRTAGCCYQYGSWIWFRFLSETMGPDVIREIWERADGSAVGPDDYSTLAIRHVLAAHGTSFVDRFAQFAVWNRIPALRYSEGRHYPSPLSSGSFRLGATHTSTGWLGLRLRHMSSVYIGLRPGRRDGRRAHLTVAFDGPARSTAPEGSLLVFHRSGAVKVKRFTLDRHGDGSLRVPFGRGRITRVVLAMSDAGAHFACGQGTQYSCQGVPLDDKLLYTFRARIH